jgi:hypothetical protein
VAHESSTVVAGAPGKDGATGAAFVFVRSGEVWSQQAKLVDPAPIFNDFFGQSVSMSDNTVLVGVAGKNLNRGAARLFRRVGVTWSDRLEFAGPNPRSNDLFGLSVAISGSVVVVGASGKDKSTGAAYAFDG